MSQLEVRNRVPAARRSHRLSYVLRRLRRKVMALDCVCCFFHHSGIALDIGVRSSHHASQKPSIRIWRASRTDECAGY